MSLILEVVRYNSQPVNDGPSCHLESGGGCIGRNPGSDLCLNDADRIVSGKHAEIFFQGGRYFITDTSTNGLFVNAGSKPLGRGNSVPIEDNDCFTIGPYEVRATLAEAAEADAGIAPVPSQPDLDDDSAPWDPLSDFGAGKSAAPAHPVIHQPVPRAAPDPLEPPGFPEQLGGSNPLIPETGRSAAGPGETFSDFAPLLSAHVPPPVSHEPVAPPKIIGDDWDDGSGDVAPGGGTTGPIPESYSPLAPKPQQHTPPPVPKAPVPDPPPRRTDEFMRTVLDSAGLNDLSLNDAEAIALARNLGEALREMVAGVSEVLRLRSEFKSELRIDETRLRPEGNNPFKFPRDAGMPIAELLTGTSPGSLHGPEAVREAFRDIRVHQLAVMAGVRGCLTALLERINPDDIQAAIDSRGGLDNLVPGNRQAKYWERFREIYGSLSDDAREGFQALLGNDFAQAYNLQERRIRESGRGEGSDD